MKNILLFLISLIFCFSISAKNIQLVFRYDDFVLKSDSLNEGVVRLFQKHHIPLVLGVIPYNSSEKQILEENYPVLQLLKVGVSNHTIEIALHGLNHINISKGEFGNVAIEEQNRRIHKGKNQLDSIFKTKIVTFIPPWNTYDANTLEVIDNNGIKGISSTLCTGQPWSNPHIRYFPETIEDFGTLYSVLKYNKNRNVVVVVMFHHYTFNKNFSLLQLDNLLSKVDNLDYVKCFTFSQLYIKKEISDNKRMEANLEVNLLSKYLHLDGAIQTSIFVCFIRIFNLMIYLFLSTFIYIFSLLLLFRIKDAFSTVEKLIIGSLLLIVIGIGVRFHILGPIKMLIVVAILSISHAFLFKIKFLLLRLKIIKMNTNEK